MNYSISLSIINLIALIVIPTIILFFAMIYFKTDKKDSVKACKPHYTNYEYA